MSNLATFLLARIEEDERAAYAAETRPFLADEPDRWWPYDRPSALGIWASQQENGAGRRVAYVSTEPERAHIIRWDPARVQIGCEARRDIVRKHVGYGGICGTCGVGEPAGERWPCRTLRLLAWPYLGHPDYEDRWLP